MRGGVSTAIGFGCAAVLALGGWTSAAAAGASTGPHPAGGAPSIPGLPSAFSWFAPGPAPANFRLYTAVQGTVVVADPPKLKLIGGTGGALSFAARNRAGTYFAYLNVTPQQGAENLTGWAAFRLALLRTDHARDVHEDAEASNLPFRGGTGACVIDDYVTGTRNSAFHEIACFVEGPHSGSVIVVATPPSSWRSYAVPLERVISSYRVM